MREPLTQEIPSPDLPRRLGLWSSIGVVIGITIGSGIFRTPATIASRVPDPLWMMGVWVLGGVVTLCGALTIAELAAMFPRTGGIYVYLREGFGRPVGFLFGWAQLVLIRASALGGLATVFSEYFLRSVGLDPAVHEHVADAIAALALIVTAVLNIVGVRFSAAVVSASTVAKFGALVVLIAAAAALGAEHGASLAHLTMSSSAPVQAGLFGLSLVSVLWAYDGFLDVSFVGGEVIDPQRTMPRAIVGGTIAIVVIYLAANVAYLYLFPVTAIAGAPLIAADTMGALFGRIGVSIVSIVVMVSVFGSLNGTVLASPRIFFAMAADDLFFRRVARVHPRRRTPHVAIVIATCLGILFVLLGSFQQLADTFVLSIWPFYALAGVAVYRLRATRPDLVRPYRVPGYPVVPAIFLAGSLYLILNALVTDTRSTTLTFAAMLAGLPVYYLVFAKFQPPTSNSQTDAQIPTPK